MKKPEIFYGWWIVFAVFAISAYTNGAVFYSFTAIIEPIVKEFDWSYTQASLAASMRGFEASFLGPVVGIMFDRFGPRRLIFLGGTLIAAGLFLLSQTHSMLTFYIAFFLMTTGLGACAGFLLSTVLGNWFRRRMSIASGIALCGGAAGGLLVPLVTRLIDATDWRTAMVILAAGTVGIVLPLSFIVRHKPEQYGYLPDGDKASVKAEDKTSAPALDTGHGMTIGQILKTRAFWQISLGFMCHYIVVSALLTHIMPYLGTKEITRTSASFVASGIPVISIIGRIGYGWLGDRVDKKRLAASGYLLIVLALVLLLYIADLGNWILIPFIILFGIGFGGPVPMALTMLLETYGRHKFATTVGTCMAVLMMGSILGPPVAGWFFDHYGSYQYAWYIFIGVTVVGMLGVLTIPGIKKTPRTSVGSIS